MFAGILLGLRNITAQAPLKMLMINSPHNPTGAAFDQSQLDVVTELLSKLPQAEPPVLFSDEMHLGCGMKGFQVSKETTMTEEAALQLQRACFTD